MFTRIDHIAINIKNLIASTKFYVTTFGFTILFEDTIPSGHKINYLKLNDTILELHENYQGEINGSHFCLHSDDFDKDYNYLINNNIKLFRPVHHTNPRASHEIGWKRAVFLGLDNEQIEIRGK